MGSDTEERRVIDEPSDDDRLWRRWAVVSFCFAVTAFLFAAIWVFEAQDSSVSVDRAQAFSPFGAAAVAIVTFFTIIWRGILNSRQLEYQAAQLRHQVDQINQVIRQNDTKDEENRARFLQDGARLLSDQSQPQQVLAGIVTLNLLLRKSGNFGGSAMDLLADFYDRARSNETLSNALELARTTLAGGARMGLRSRIDLVLEEEENTRWKGLRGFGRQYYHSGTIGNEAYTNLAGENVSYTDVTFKECVIDREENYWKCTFENCHIVLFAAFSFDDCTFVACDFSGCTVREDPSGNRIGDDSVYLSNEPPVGYQAEKFIRVLTPVERKPDYREWIFFGERGDLCQL